MSAKTISYPPTLTIPWNHQKIAWEKSKAFSEYYYAMDMGAGKSHSAIAYMLGFNCTANLIICPKAVINVWPKQFELHSSVNYNIYLGNNGHSVEKKAAEIQDFIKRSISKGQPYTIVLNYESFWRPPLGPIYEKFKLIHQGLLKSLDWDLMLLDECVPAKTKISTPNGYIPIEKLKKGDLVYGYDHTSSQKTITKVVHTFKNQTTTPLISIDKLKLTPNHPVFINNKYKNAEKIKDGDTIFYETTKGIYPYLLSAMWKRTYKSTNKKAPRKIKGISKQRKFSILKGMDDNTIQKQGNHNGPSDSTLKNKTVYNIETETGNYFAENILVHNCHKIKSAGSKVSWGAMRIGQSAKRRLCLSGTPMPHSVGDIYAQFRFLNTNIFGSSSAHFKAEYCKMGGFNGKQIVGVQDPKKLGKQFFSRAYRVRTQDVMQLPPSRHQQIPITLSPKAMKTYKELEKEFITWVDQEEVSVDNALTRMLRLSQMSCGFYQDGTGNKVHLIDDIKIETIIDQIDNLNHNEPVIIVCKFRPEIELVRTAIEKRNKKLPTAEKYKARRIGELSGKADDLMEWQNGNLDVLIVQIQSGNAGVDFTRAAYMFISSTGFSTGNYLQLLARILRPGQIRPVMYYHFHSQNTIDQKIFQSIQKRIADVKKILDSPTGSIGNGVTMRSIQKDILNDAVNDIKNRLGITNKQPVTA